MTSAPADASARALRGAWRDDRGSALIITLMVMALVTALATTVSVVTINNLQSSWRAQQAGSALNAADAGVAQAMTYLRGSGVRDLRCSPSCVANPWGSSSAPTTVALPGKAGQTYLTWIEVVSPYSGRDPGLYRIHSTGTAAGAASRAVTLDVHVTMIDVPRGVFARSIGGGGSASVERESVFSTGCVSSRDKLGLILGELDLAYGIPVGVHSSQYITEEAVNTQDCSLSDKKLIHRSGNQNATPQPCNAAYPYDQDRLGDSLAGTGCAGAATTYPTYYGTRDLDGDGVSDVRGSYLEDEAALFALFGFKKPALSAPEIDRLRATAQAQGNYWSTESGFSSPDEPNAVMFFDLKGAQAGGTVNLNNIVGFGRDQVRSAESAACPTRSLVIVVEGGNVTLNSNQKLYASLFLTSPAPYGQVYKANGTAEFIGTIYADTVNLVGNVTISTDECFQSNTSPGLLDLRVGVYREVDRGLS
jgi:Tfp pilus assembly protein PilX